MLCVILYMVVGRLLGSRGQLVNGVKEEKVDLGTRGKVCENLQPIYHEMI